MHFFIVLFLTVMRGTGIYGRDASPVTRSACNVARSESLCRMPVHPTLTVITIAVYLLAIDLHIICTQWPKLYVPLMSRRYAPELHAS